MNPVTQQRLGAAVFACLAVMASSQASADNVVADDQVVIGSLCVGFDCINEEPFGFDTIRLKENNLRMDFEDTSVGTFPSNDWGFEFNSSLNNGDSYFMIQDRGTLGGNTNSVFRIDAGPTGGVALGFGATTTGSMTVSFGTAGGERRLTNVAAATAGTDAVNLDQMTAAISAAGGGVTQAYVDNADAATLVAANAHADAGDASTLAAATAHADAGDAATLVSANSHADAGDAATLTAANAHADAGDASTLAAATTHADAGDAATLVSANNFATAGDAATLASANANSDAGDIATLDSAKAYSDAAGTAVLASANDRADLGDVATLGSANTYTDVQTAATLGSANTYTDTRSTATLGSANAYTDSRIQAISQDFTQFQSDVWSRLDRTDRRIDRSGAMNTAMSQMTANAAGARSSRGRIAVGAGEQNGKAALSIGYGRLVGDRASLTLGAAFSGSDSSAGIGMGFDL